MTVRITARAVATPRPISMTAIADHVAVPNIVAAAVDGPVASLPDLHQLASSDIDWWAKHPGGATVYALLPHGAGKE
jgi:hypothetical protein